MIKVVREKLPWLRQRVRSALVGYSIEMRDSRACYAHLLTSCDLVTSGASGVNPIIGFQALGGLASNEIAFLAIARGEHVKSETLTVKPEIDLKHSILK